MCPDKTNENIAHHKLDDNNQPVPVSPDIEYIMLVSHRINGPEVSTDIGKSVPLSRLRNLIPSFKGDFRIFPSRSLIKLP